MVELRAELKTFKAFCSLHCITKFPKDLEDFGEFRNIHLGRTSQKAKAGYLGREAESG